MAKRTIFIVNPNSNSGKTAHQFKKREKELLSVFHDAEVVFSKAPHDATHLTREALKKKADMIVAVGGDGTVNEVLNGFFEDSKAIRDTAELAVLESGTGGDFRRTLGYPKSLDKGILKISKGTAKRVDIGRLVTKQQDGSMCERYFLNVASVGLSAQVARRVDAQGLRKKWFTYILATIQELRNKRAFSLRLTIDGKSLKLDRTSMLAFANAQYFGGGMQIAPMASLDDGLAEIIAIKEVNALFFIMHAHRLFRGTHLELPQVSHWQGREMQIEANLDEDIFVEADGELCGLLPATFQILPGAINLIH